MKDLKITSSNRPTPIPPKKKAFYIYAPSLVIDHVCFCDYPAQAELWFRDWCRENGLGEVFVSIREVDWHLLG